MPLPETTAEVRAQALRDIERIEAEIANLERDRDDAVRKAKPHNDRAARLYTRIADRQSELRRVKLRLVASLGVDADEAAGTLRVPDHEVTR